MIDQAAEYLRNHPEATLVLMKEATLYTSSARGVRPLLDAYENGFSFAGWVAADRCIGKAMAFLYHLLKVKEVYAFLISESAIETLERFGIAYSYAQKTDRILNNEGNDLCPMEKVCRDLDDPEEAVGKMEEQLKKLRGNL